MKLLKWMNDEENVSRQAAFRFSMVILAGLLLGMNYGRSLTPEIAGLCNLFGLSGFAFYFCLELVAEQRRRKQEHVSRQSAEQRLAWRLQADASMAAIVGSEKSHLQRADERVPHSGEEKKDGQRSGNKDEQHFGNIESAMDSTVELGMYLGPTSQPVLSV